TFVANVADQNWKIAGVGDFDGNGKADIFWVYQVNGLTQALTVWLMNGASPVGGGTPQALADPIWQAAGFGDINGDGKCDVIWFHPPTGRFYAFIMNGAVAGFGDFIGIPAVQNNLELTAVADFNGDGRAD